MPPKGPTDIIVVPGAICWRIIGSHDVYGLTGHKSNFQTNYTTNNLSIGRSGGIETETVLVATAIVIKQVVMHLSMV